MTLLISTEHTISDEQSARAAFFSSYENCKFYPHLPEHLKNERDIVKQVLHHRFYLLKNEWYTKGYRNDKELALIVVSVHGNMYKHVSNELKNDKEVLMTALARTSQFFWHIPEHFKNDREVVFLALTHDNDGTVYEQLPHQFKYDMDLMSEVIKLNPDLICGLSDYFTNNPHFMKIALATEIKNHHPISWIGDELNEQIKFFMSKEEHLQDDKNAIYIKYLDKIIFHQKLEHHLDEQKEISKNKL